ncbi:hypothetical protein [Spongiactinospora sp. TRM90649]|uniref:hypothetical protein n=1 Tax=Spongiactinospora sp. TRM90649 TaxID=3031114 RepID=UPI0023F93173|nr:hypothetical protein [Spongiactinospora sp. TRM90649]MDF5758395.1 hypothetical protein [Spongiactinospora sp. TRM90649]
MPLPEELDPTQAHTVADLAVCLRRAQLLAGNPSLRELEQRARRQGRSLPRSSTGDMLGGKRLPRKTMMLTFLQACGINPGEDPRWLVAWNRLAAFATATPDHRPLSEDILADVRTAGLTRIGTTYLTDMQWSALFADVRELDIYMAYGQTWARMHARDLSRLAARPGARIRVVLADPDDERTVAVLAARFDLTVAELRRRITDTRADYAALRSQMGATIEIYYRAGDRMFSFYRLDDTAVLGFYSHARTRAASVPVFVCERPGELYDFILEEWQAVIGDSRPA